MTYAHITNGTVDTIGRLPNSARRTDTQQWVLGLATAPVELQRACGWYEVVDTPRPDDTPTTTTDRSVELVNGTPTVVWTQRNKTPDEIASDTATTNGETIRTQATAALDANRTFLAIATPTAGQNAAQCKQLTRQMNGLIRLTLGTLDGTD